jgi:hypothetical protein
MYPQKCSVSFPNFPIRMEIPLALKNQNRYPPFSAQKKGGAPSVMPPDPEMTLYHQRNCKSWSNYCPIPRRKESSTPPTYAGFKLVGGMALLKSDCEFHLYFPFRFHALQRSWSVSENVVCSTLRWQR